MKKRRKKNTEGFIFSNRLLVGYQDVFGKSAGNERLENLRKVSKTDIIVELAGLNYRLKGKKDRHIDTTFDTQRKELLYFCGQNPSLYEKYAKLLDEKANGKEVYIFSRQTCLFALEEVTQSDLQVIDGFNMSDSFSSWEAILQYILCVNDEVTRIEESKPDEPINFETLNPKLLPISELMIVSDPFDIVYRGWNLMTYFKNHEETSLHLSGYFEERYNVDYERFVFELLSLWMANKHEQEHFNFYYIVADDNESKPILNALSKSYDNPETYKLLNIRKNPFFKNSETVYILTDLANLLDKGYYQLINDFFFDKLRFEERRPGKKFSMQDYKGILGGFFESYVRDKIQYSLGRSKLSRSGLLHIKMFEQLNIIIPKKGLIESGDIYIRHENKVILGEVKASSLYDDEKYGGNVDAMYKNDRNQFFKSFGVDQLVTNIKNLDSNTESIDPKFRQFKKVRIWPIIVFNEKAFQTPFMAHIFNSRFMELVKGVENDRYYVYPLTLVHISDLENMESSLSKNPLLLWKLLTENFSNPLKYIPPFYYTLNKNNIKSDYRRFRREVPYLFKKFGKNLDNTETRS